MRGLSILKTDIRFAALFCALILYGAFGSPTPDDPAWIEAVIGLLLIAALTIPASMSPRMVFAPLLAVGLTVPLAAGLFHGYGVDNILRDLVPFLFLCLPFFIGPQRYAPVFLHLCLLVGVMFAMRVLGQGMEIFSPATELLYLSNSPLVLMAAIIGLGRAAMDVYDRKITIETFVFFCGGVVCLLAMLVDVQRATITAVIVSLAALGGIGLIRNPRRMIWPVIIAAAVMLASWEIIASAWHGMATKTALVGVNMRWQELVAVYDRLRGEWFHVLFGIGWGGRFESPAVGGWSVPYTHSLLTYMFLKTGVAGLGATLIALAACVRNIIAYPSLLSLALFWAIIIPVFFYASYKSLDFGLVLVLALILPRAIASKSSS